MTDGDYLHVLQQVLLPAAYEFAPELVVVSAGFDAAQADPLGRCRVTPAGFAHMLHALMGLGTLS